MEAAARDAAAASTVEVVPVQDAPLDLNAAADAGAEDGTVEWGPV